jgi:putative tryptophan/tyrosine transport system substrate-binding protein
MNRRAFVTGLGAVLAAPLGAGAQPAHKIPRIGVVFPAEAASPNEPNGVAFRQGLRDLGYVEDQTIAVEYRYAHGRTERNAELARELVQLKVDVIVAGGTATFAARDATKTTPIVSIAAGDVVGLGLVASFARPGGNVTGLSMVVEEGIGGKWVQLLKEAAPSVSRVAYLRDASTPSSASLMRDMQSAARALGLKFHVLEVRELSELDSAFGAMSRERGGGLITAGQPLFFPHRSRIHELAMKHRLPVLYGWRLFVDAGGLMSYGPSLPDLWRRAATYVDRILKGANPADMPVEEPTKLELVINLKTAKALGLTIPPSLLAQADQVIE